MHAKYNVILLTFVYQIIKKKIMFNHVRINQIPVLTKKSLKKFLLKKLTA